MSGLHCASLYSWKALGPTNFGMLKLLQTADGEVEDQVDVSTRAAQYFAVEGCSSHAGGR